MCQISSLMAAAEGPVAKFSSFANFEVFPLLSADSRYFRIYALKEFTDNRKKQYWMKRFGCPKIVIIASVRHVCYG